MYPRKKNSKKKKKTMRENTINHRVYYQKLSHFLKSILIVKKFAIVIMKHNLVSHVAASYH